MTPPWTKAGLQQALKRGPHKSTYEYLGFLEGKFVEMINKRQWVILPYTRVQDLPNLRLSPPGCVPQRDRRPRWICDYTFSEVNQETLELFAQESMQFGHTLDRFLREILLSDPDLGPLSMIKADIANEFYRIDLVPADIPKLGVVFPTRRGQEPLVALPLVLPMGWKNSPPIFTTATETIADLANANIRNKSHTPLAHHLDDKAASVPLPEDTTTYPSLNRDALPSRDPCLPTNVKLPGYIDVFVDDFIALIQGSTDASRVRRILLHAIDQVFRPLHPSDHPMRQEPVSLKKLLKWDCSWSTSKKILGWIIDTTARTITLPDHRVQRLAEILGCIPKAQKRIGVTKWHQVLGELRLMSLALPGARNLFGHMKLALASHKGNCISLKKRVHQSLQDFRWLLRNISTCPTRIAELILLLTSAVGHHDASKDGAGGVWFPTNHLTPRLGHPNQPIVWRFAWPPEIKRALVTEGNPSGTITNSDLELVGGLLHLQAICQAYDVRECTILSKTDNLATLFWQGKGSATTDKCPHYLLRLFGIHQRFHRYVPRHDYLSGPSNPIADASSRLFNLTNQQFLNFLTSHYRQKKPYHMLTMEPAVLSSVISALQMKPSKPASLLVEPAPPQQPGNNGKPSVLNWPSTPFSKPSKTRYQSYKSLPNEFEMENLQSKGIQSALGRLKITYGALHRRSSVWGPKTHV